MSYPEIIDYKNLNPAIANQNLLGNYYNRTFSQIFPEPSMFESAYLTSGLYDSANSIEKITLLYYLLYAKYGNSVIASYDENRFMYELFSIIFMYGPTWETKLKIQEEMRGLLATGELLDGGTNINNHSYNPSTAPNTDAFDPLTTINDQTANRRKKSKMEAYGSLLANLKTDITKEFIDRFAKLFLVIVEPNEPLWYTTTPEEQEILEL